MMTVLITGGGGFVGAWVAKRLLARGMGVRMFDLRRETALLERIAGPDAAAAVEWVIGDITDSEALTAASQGCSGVVHLAALLTPACQQDPVLGARINVIGTLNVFEAAKAVGLSNVVYTSSVSVFGPDDGVHPLPSTHYGAFKLANEGCARTYWEHDGLSSVGIRPGVVYGPGREVGLSAGPSLACRAAARGEDYEIGYSGDTSLIHVDDLAAIYERLVVTGQDGARVFNATGARVTMPALVGEIEKHNPGIAITAAGAPLPFSADISDAALHEAFPDLPQTSLEDGIAGTVAFYREA